MARMAPLLVLRVAALLLQVLIISPAACTLPCQSPEDCSLNGECIPGNGECMCHRGWIGQDCGTLDVLPLPLPITKRAPPGVSYGTLASPFTSGLASWGGSLLQDPTNSSRYHLFAAEISQGCGLDAWYRNSVIVHATASSPLGPFIRQAEVLPAFSHEPTVVALPHGGFVMYKIGCADRALTGSNGTSLRGLCTGCHNGSTEVAGAHCSAPDQSYERACQDVLHADSLDGPWTRSNLSGFAAGRWDWERLNLGLESHAPVILNNGSILTFTRAIKAPQPAPLSSIWLVGADSWNGTYRSLSGSASTFTRSAEDSFMVPSLTLAGYASMCATCMSVRLCLCLSRKTSPSRSLCLSTLISVLAGLRFCHSSGKIHVAISTRCFTTTNRPRSVDTVSHCLP